MSTTTSHIRLDASWLNSVGLGDLRLELADQFLASTHEHLEMRVGAAIAATMTDDQLDEFEAFIDNDDAAGAVAWLEANFPHYRDVVRDEFDSLTDEVRSRSLSILDAVARLEAEPWP